MYSNTYTTIPAYGAHHHHHSDVGKALGVLALLASILRDPNPGKTLGDLVAGVGMLIGALIGVGLFIHLWSVSPVLVGLAVAGCFLLNQRFTSTNWHWWPPRKKWPRCPTCGTLPGSPSPPTTRSLRWKPDGSPGPCAVPLTARPAKLWPAVPMPTGPDIPL